MRDYCPSPAAPVKMEETVVKTEPMGTIKLAEEWPDSSQLEHQPTPPRPSYAGWLRNS